MGSTARELKEIQYKGGFFMKMKKVMALATAMACAATLFAGTAVTASAAEKKK